MSDIEKKPPAVIYSKAENFETVFCNGVRGGFTATDECCFVLFREKPRLPDNDEMAITVNREEQVEIIMTMSGVKMLTGWLNKLLENKPGAKKAMFPLIHLPVSKN